MALSLPPLHETKTRSFVSLNSFDILYSISDIRNSLRSLLLEDIRNPLQRQIHRRNVRVKGERWGNLALGGWIRSTGPACWIAQIVAGGSSVLRTTILSPASGYL